MTDVHALRCRTVVVPFFQSWAFYNQRQKSATKAQSCPSASPVFSEAMLSPVLPRQSSSSYLSMVQLVLQSDQGKPTHSWAAYGLKG